MKVEGLDYLHHTVIYQREAFESPRNGTRTTCVREICEIENGPVDDLALVSWHDMLSRCIRGRGVAIRRAFAVVAKMEEDERR